MRFLTVWLLNGDLEFNHGFNSGRLRSQGMGHPEVQKFEFVFAIKVQKCKSKFSIVVAVFPDPFRRRAAMPVGK